MSVDGRALLSSYQEGVHVATLPMLEPGETAGSGPMAGSFGPDAGLAASEWAQKVPDGALVLVAVISTGARHSCRAVFEALAASGLPVEVFQSGQLPRGCRAAAALGKKGESDWSDSHAAADMAFVTGPPFTMELANSSHCETHTL